MTVNGVRGGASADPCDDGRPSSPRVDELCMLVGKIVSADQEAVNKVHMCVEKWARRQDREAENVGRSQTSPGGEIAQRQGRGRSTRVVIEKDAKDLEIYWNKMVEVDQTAASFDAFYSHVTVSHCERNMIAHCVVDFGKSELKNVGKGRVYSKKDLTRQLEHTKCALRDANKIYRYLKMVDYDEYLGSIKAD